MSTRNGDKEAPRFPGANTFANGCLSNWNNQSQSVRYLDGTNSSHSKESGSEQSVEHAPVEKSDERVQRGGGGAVRPPLPPFARSPNGKNKHVPSAKTHTREISEMSALTADSFDAGEEKVAQHKRGVSWGRDFHHLVPKQQLPEKGKAPLQGGSNEEAAPHPTPQPVPEGLPQPRLSPLLLPVLNQEGGHKRTSTQITLADISSPLGDEAENAIISAIEKREWENDHEDEKLCEALGKKQQSTRPVLPNVTDKTIKVVEEELVDVSSKESNVDSVEVSLDGDNISDAEGRKKEEVTKYKKEPSLKELAGKLKRMQSTRQLQKIVESSKEEDETQPSSVDVLANNANILFGRGSSDNDEDDDNFDVEAQIPAMRPSHKRTTSVMSDRRLAVPENSSEASTKNVTNGKRDNAKKRGNGDRTSDLYDNAKNRKTRFYLRRKTRKSKEVLQEVLKPQLPAWKLYIKFVVFLVFCPMLGVSSILFYLAGNPIETGLGASWSWWVLFLGVRQVITFSLSKLTEVVLIDLFTLHTRLTLKIFGPFITLMSVQARGWPYILTFWAVWDFSILHGGGKFANHWLYYQSYIQMFNPNYNPSGNVLTLTLYLRILLAAIVVGVTVSLKRVFLAMYLGRKSFEHYGPQLENLMHKMLLLSEVAHLSEQIANTKSTERLQDSCQYGRASTYEWDAYRGLKRSTDDEDEEDEQSDIKSVPSPPTPPQLPNNETPPQPLQQSVLRLRKNTEDMTTRSGQSLFSPSTPGTQYTPDANEDEEQAQAHLKLRDSDSLKLYELLGEWQEPEIKSGSKVRRISVEDILQYRRGVACMDGRFPFSTAFGPAKTREQCAESAQNVYERLKLLQPGINNILSFETIALIAVNVDGDLDEKKAKKLLRLFRPNRDGYLTALDFVKSCDKIYKRLRMLRAAVANSSQIDLAFEQILNVGFYFVLGMVVLSICDFDPWTLFISLSGLILSFAFMFGSAASKYFEGILLILVRRPYDIGDRIHVSTPDIDTSPNGSATWYVEGVSLFTTTVRNATTNEVATYANGSLANSRIINGARSPKALVYIFLKFASDISYEKVMVFKSVVEKFVKERPRQWIAMPGFRATRVETDLGYIEYVIVLQHVESWQNIIPILTSKAEVSSYCLEVQRKLDMKYSAPPLPVNLGMGNSTEILEQASLFEKSVAGGRDISSKPNEVDFGALSNLFSQNEVGKSK